MGCMTTKHKREILHRLQPAFQCGGYPPVKERFRRLRIRILPESLKLVFQNPCPVNVQIGSLQCIQPSRIAFGAVPRMYEQEPSKSFERLLIIPFGFPPFFLAHVIDCLVESFDDMKPVYYQNGRRTPVFDGAQIRLAHITGCEPDFHSLFLGQCILEKLVCGLSAFSLADPDYALSIHVINNRSVFFPFVIRYLINAELVDIRYPMSRPQSLNGAVQNIGQRRMPHLQQLRSRFLRHDLAEQQHQIFQPVGNAGVTIRPWYPFLYTAVRRARYLAGRIKKMLRIPQTTTSSHCRHSARAIIVPRRPQKGHRQPVLCGFTPRWSVFRSSRTANHVTIKPFIRSRRDSSLLPVMGSSLRVCLSSNNKQYNPVGARDLFIMSKNLSL